MPASDIEGLNNSLPLRGDFQELFVGRFFSHKGILCESTYHLKGYVCKIDTDFPLPSLPYT